MKQIKTDQQVEFNIYGNIEEEAYYKGFENEIKTYGNVTIAYKGVLSPALIPTTFLYADYLLLPTSHENYGHAIVEAWANGCPVVISQNTPWRDLKAKKIGWDVDISDPANLVNAIQEGVHIEVSDYLEMVNASYNYFKNEISEEGIIEANRKLFYNAC